MSRKVSLIIFVAMLLLTSCMTASFSGDYVVKSGQTLHGNMFVTSGNVTLEENSRVTGTIMLTSGVLRINKNAQVGGDVVLTSGDVYLAEGSVIHGDLILSSSDLGVHRSPGSIIEGTTTSNIAPFIGSVITRLALLYCLLPIVIIIALIVGLVILLTRRPKKREPIIQPTAPVLSEDITVKLQNLKKMLDGGLISQTDYDAKKADLLSKM